MTDVMRVPGSHVPSRPGTTTVMWCQVFDWDREGWRELAACRQADARLFFPVGTTGASIDTLQAAKAVCGRCPVRDACLQFALETKQEDGVWGGTDEDERRRLRRAWRAGRARLPRRASA